MNVRLVCVQNGEPSRTIKDFPALLAYGRVMIPTLFALISVFSFRVHCPTGAQNG
jgi:hypothetical protein